MPQLTPKTRERIQSRLAFIYGEAAAPAVAQALTQRLERFEAAPRGTRAGWDQGRRILITYGDSIQEPGLRPLATLHAFLQDHLSGAFDSVHVLPFFPYSSDDGYSVVDFREVDPKLGTWEDISALAADFGLVVDLVINHCSRNSLWFADYLADRAPYNDYFIEVDPGANTSLVTRPRTSPLLTPIRTHRGEKLLWTTFSNDQMDLNFRNPRVLLEMIDILLDYLAAGASIVRLDAVAYLWKELATTCIHLPQTHAVVKLLRDVLGAVAPDCLLLTETNVPNAENRSYFGAGDEAHVIYQFSLPPLLLQALHTGCTNYLVKWARELEADPPPPGCTYLNFTASHDGVGLRPLEGLMPPDELALLLDGMRARGGYLSSRRTSAGTESPYELNISYFNAFRDPRLQPDPWHIECFMVSQVVALSMQGIPAVYIHALTATPNDHLGVELTGRTRTINRRKWDRSELEGLIADPDSETGQVFGRMTHVLRLRAEHPAFHPDGPQRILDLGAHLFGFEREAPDGGERIVCLFNFVPGEREVDLGAALGPEAGDAWRELIGGASVPADQGRLRLPGYAAWWLTEEES